ncbi:MAG TPA: hypothetical protein VMU32_08885 [Solirubrobacteraceae bacterium]|nr:hypothetical protein [Solirubrobacteraceae bacterium]
MPSPIPPQAPRGPLPSRRTGAILAAAMLAAGIALGALIGPGPASSLTGGTRAAAIARALAPLLALDGAGSAGLLGATQASDAPASSTTGGAAATHRATTSAGSETLGAAAGTGHGGLAGSGASTGPATESSSPSSGATSPTGTRRPATNTTKPSGAGGEPEAKWAALPPIAHAWLIVLPYGQSFANARAQPSAAPYLDSQLIGQGTLLSAYSALAGSQLADAATLLSGQVGAEVDVLSPPPCADTADATPGASGTSGATETAGATGAQSAQSPAPCPAGEPAGLQAADAYVREVVSRLVTTAGYREHGLIAITFAAGPSAAGPSAAGASAAAPGTPAGGPTTATTEAAYPAGTQATTLTDAAPAPGVLLLSPFLRDAGRHLASAFDAAAPRGSLEEALTKPKDP